MNTDNTDQLFLLLAILGGIMIILFVTYYVIRTAVKSAINDELKQIRVLLEWHLSKQYRGIKNIRRKSNRLANLVSAMNNNEELFNVGNIKEDKFKKIKESFESEIEKALG